MRKDTIVAVRTRAGDRCEYCLMPQSVRRLKFQIDHVIATQHGGDDSLENLAFACGRCNRHKGTNIAGIDPLTRQQTRLFDPRRDRWRDHFRWEGLLAIGITAIGRTTVDLLGMNHAEDVAVRHELLKSNRFPPSRST